MKERLGIAGLFMVVFLMCAAFISATALWQAHAEAPTLKAYEIVTGRWSPDYEKLFNKKVYTYDFSKNSWGALNYSTFQEGNKGVLVGDNGWLFTSEEFDLGDAKGENLQNNLDYIYNVRDHLASKNIALLVVPIPAKARIYEEHLGRYPYPSYKKDIYQSFLKSMNGRDIAVVDISGPMTISKSAHGMFLKTDTHWTPEGAHVAASEISKYVAENMKDFTASSAYKSMPKDQAAYEGDLLRYIPVGNLSKRLNLPQDQITAYETVETGIEPAAGEAEASMEEALFSSNTPQITLVGTSYSANARWNFEGFLKEALGMDVLNVADEGLGPFETMQKYLGNEAFHETPPKLVIWEIPERYLTFKYDLKTDFAQGTES